MFGGGVEALPDLARAWAALPCAAIVSRCGAVGVTLCVCVCVFVCVCCFPPLWQRRTISSSWVRDPAVPLLPDDCQSITLSCCWKADPTTPPHACGRLAD